MENQDFNTTVMTEEMPESGKATAALVLSIIGLLCCSPCSIVGLILAIIAKKAGNTSGKCTAALIISIIGLVIWVISLIVMFAGGGYATYMETITSAMG